VHKHRNLLAHAPERLHDEVTADYTDMIYAATPDEIEARRCRAVADSLEESGERAADIAAIGIANQRETALLWDRATGRALHRAIVWQDRRTAALCARLKETGNESRTLLFDIHHARAAPCPSPRALPSPSGAEGDSDAGAVICCAGAEIPGIQMSADQNDNPHRNPTMAFRRKSRSTRAT
jgi:hypothetical protein